MTSLAIQSQSDYDEAFRVEIANITALSQKRVFAPGANNLSVFDRCRHWYARCR